MKLLLCTLLFALTTQAQARTVTDEKELQQYKDAVLSVDSFVNCIDYSEASFRNITIFHRSIIDNAQSLEVTEGRQPLLIFTELNENEDAVKFKFQTLVSTDQSYKNILSIVAVAYKAGIVNRGDLRNPNMGPGYVPLWKANCTK